MWWAQLNWVIDNPKLDFISESCRANIPSKIVLKPGEKFEESLHLRTLDKGSSEVIEFKLGFKGDATAGIVWSNEASSFSKKILKK